MANIVIYLQLFAKSFFDFTIMTHSLLLYEVNINAFLGIFRDIQRNIEKFRDRLSKFDRLSRFIMRIKGQVLILVCLVNFQSSGKGSNSSSEHVGNPVFDF